jgi:flagellar biosynthesis component FlhA
VAIGLSVRSYLSHLNLLLIARISAVVVIVVVLMAAVAILSFKLHITEFSGITFFPMIILAWTIERMSILWEEEGPEDVLVQGGGSLIVAVLSYFVMTNTYISFITFNFPEILLAVLGIIILMGRYTGYRLSELYRFASLAKEAEATAGEADSTAGGADSGNEGDRRTDSDGGK